MCWITLSPKDSQVHGHQHHRQFHHHHDEHSSLRSSIEHLIRRDRLAHETPMPTSQCEGRRQERIRVITLGAGHHHRHRHHYYHDVHPLRLHPVPMKLHGPGKKRAPVPPRRSPTSSGPEQEPIYRIQPVPKPRVVPDPIYGMQPIPTPRPGPDPIYRIQPIPKRADPRVHEIRETTRFALREVKPERTRLRRVAGYEVLSKQVPWSWDCVSRSTS